jgi:hypothetical protein
MSAEEYVEYVVQREAYALIEEKKKACRKMNGRSQATRTRACSRYVEVIRILACNGKQPLVGGTPAARLPGLGATGPDPRRESSPS